MNIGLHRKKIHDTLIGLQKADSAAKAGNYGQRRKAGQAFERLSGRLNVLQFAGAQLAC